MWWGAEGIRKINTNSCNRKHNAINTTNMTYKERYVKDSVLLKQNRIESFHIHFLNAL